jgi:glycine hydroxymethyltransferase
MATHDPELSRLLEQELARQRTTLTLIASENHCSPAVREACASVLTDKYAEGYPGARYYGGCEVADAVEQLAKDRALKLFPGMAHANVQPHCGTTTNVAVLVALAGSGGKLLGMALASGGHLSHGHKVSHTGILFSAVQYGVRPDTGLIDYDQVRSLAKEHRPKVIIAGGSSYPREIDYEAIAGVCKEVDAKLLADIAHPAGLMAAGVMPSPVGFADVITTTTHKTLRGPRGGLILCKQELQKPIDSSVFPGAQGGPLMHQIAGKAVAFGEALQPAFKAYQQRVKDNAQHLAKCFVDRGLQVVTGGTDCHLVVVDLRSTAMTGQDVETRARAAGIVVNKNVVPNDPRPPRQTSGIRVGTPAATSRGMGKPEMETLAAILADLVAGKDPASFTKQVQELCARFPLP